MKYDIIISASGKFRRNVLEIERQLIDIGMSVATPDKDFLGWNDSIDDIQKRQLTSCHIQNIKKSSAMLIVTDDTGYVGLSVALEVGVALAIKIPIYSMHDISEPSIDMFCKKISSLRDLR